MPHKHKRKRGGDDSEFDLPPSQKARPLPVSLKSAGKNAGKTTGKTTGKSDGKKPAIQGDADPTSTKGRKKRQAKDNDAPRGFRRLMALSQGKKVRSGLDNGDGTTKRTQTTGSEELKIRPGEDLRSFSTRVDSALPVSGLTKKTIIKDGKDETGIKVMRTRKERKMHKLYEQWWAEDRKIKEKREEELELEAERELENDTPGVSSIIDWEETSGKKSRRGRGKAEEDPWKQLKRKRAEARVGLHDTAQAPPELNKKISPLLKGGVDVENVPKAAGSLRRREELQNVRADVVEAYRKIREHEQAKLTGVDNL